jgi:hypothetical protein
MSELIIPASLAMPRLIRYRRIVHTFEYKRESSEVRMYFKDDRLLCWYRLFHSPHVSQTNHPSEADLINALAKMSASSDPTVRYLANKNFDILKSSPKHRALLLSSPNHRGRPIENAERDDQIIQWLAWGRSLKIPKHQYAIAAHYRIGDVRIKQIANENADNLLIMTAESSVHIRKIFEDMKQGQEESFCLPCGDFRLIKDR